MSPSNSHPKWWQVYLTFPLLIALFMLDARLKISARGHQAMQIGVVLLIYGLIHLWLKANAVALSQMDRGLERGSIIVIQTPPCQSRDAEKQPLFQIPDSEIKGVLNDTFEMNFIEAEFSQPNTISHELDKE